MTRITGLYIIIAGDAVIWWSRDAGDVGDAVAEGLPREGTPPDQHHFQYTFLPWQAMQDATAPDLPDAAL